MYCPACGNKMKNDEPLTERIGAGLLLLIGAVAVSLIVTGGIVAGIYFSNLHTENMLARGYVKRQRCLKEPTGWTSGKYTTEWVREEARKEKDE
jgi:hypothetical protein